MTDDDCDANIAQHSTHSDAIRLDLSRFRHFGDEWQQICQTLLSCERLLAVMSDERTDISSSDDKHDAVDRQQLRQIIKSIEPKKYSKASTHRRQSQTPTRRSSYHRLKALTQLLMTSNLKRSTSLQSVPVVATTDALDDTTATLPRLRRRPKINRFYHSLDVSDDINECDDSRTKGDRRGLTLMLSSSPSTQLLSTGSEPTQKQLNRHSCDVTSLLLSPTSQTSSQSRSSDATTNRQILKYSKKRLRGPYGEMLESMMSTRNTCEEERQSLTFIQELLRETEKQRKALDCSARETTGTKDIVSEDKSNETTTPTTTTTTETTTSETTTEDNSKSITATIGRHLEARTHIIGELYDTEKSFVEQLRDLLEKYFKPLKEQLIVDQMSLDQIFGQIPDILAIHSKFLDLLRHRIANWSEFETTIGDLFKLFEEKQLFLSYSRFVDNWFESKSLIKSLSRDNRQFNKFLLEQSREHRSKLSLDELMIGIIQRIPRFELLLKQLLKNTRDSHPDHCLLEEALNKIHSLVLYINRVKNQETNQSLQTINSFIGQQNDYKTTETTLTLQQLNDICDGLPNQLLIQSTLYLISTVFIRKRERILFLFNNILIILSIKGRKKSEKFEENKYKVLNYFYLDSLELNFDLNTNELNSNEFKSFEILEKDLQIISLIQKEYSSRLSSESKHYLDSVLLELNQNISKRIIELKNSEKNLELVVMTTNNSSNQEMTTTNSSNKQQTNSDSNQNTILLTFLTQEKKEKFQKLLKQLKEEKSKPNSQIIPEFLCFLPIRKTRAGLQFTCASPTIATNDVWICNSDGFVGQISVLTLNWTQQQTTGQQQTKKTIIEPTIVSSNGVCNSRIICMTCVPRSPNIASPSQTSEESDVSDSESDTNAERNIRREESRNRSSLSSATMWFGTDDSSVHIYSCFDAIRIKKNKVKVTLSAKVEAITYFADKVFVGLANHSVAIFHREPSSGAWNTVPEIRENISCYRFCCVLSTYLWTTSDMSLDITIRDKDLKPLFDDIRVVVSSEDNSSSEDYISNIVCCDRLEKVFISTNNSLIIRIYSCLQPFNHLNSVSIESTLNRALIACEDIIRQHKSACLKISSLLAINSDKEREEEKEEEEDCEEENKNLIIIGTSAGIIVCLNSKTYKIELIPYGHTGHVRFLTKIEKREENNSIQKWRTLVISGGDGIEIYSQNKHLMQDSSSRAENSNTIITNGGRDDSTNHVILFSCK